MILTVCLNPSTDVTVELDSLTVGKLNHVKSKRVSYAGKALNVAIGVSRLQRQSFATGFMYNENGSLFEQALDKEGVASTFVWNKGRVRENYKFIDNKSMLTEVNDLGETVTENKQEELLALVSSLSKNSKAVVVSGSAPNGVESDYYKKLLQVVSSDNYKVVDATGKRLLSALEVEPDLIKPNDFELQSTLNIEFKSKKDMLKGCFTLINKGAKRVLLSLGKSGAIITDGVKHYFCKSINVAINSTVGAGDAMLAAATLRMTDGAPLDEMLKSGVAAGTATVTTFGQVSITKNKFDEIYSRLSIEEIKI